MVDKPKKLTLNIIVAILLVIGTVLVATGLLFSITTLNQVGILIFVLGIVIYIVKRLFLTEEPLLR